MLCFRCGSYNAENAPKCSVCGQDFVDDAGNVVQSPGRRTQLPASAPALFAVGDLVAGRYRILELLGQGGVGAVFKARDVEMQIDIALKAVQPNLLQTDEEQRLFARQLKAARKLAHENIVRVFEEGHEGNRRFFTMKLLEGLTLRKIIRLRHEKAQAFTPEELVPIFHQLGAALDYAHKSTWHGDLKPENVIVLPDLLKVTDFHLLRALPLKPFLGIAKTRSKGFPYIAPEIRVEAASIDGRADIYSLGVILGEMLTGIVYEGHFTRGIVAAFDRLPPRLDALVRRAVSEHPDGRFAKASDFAGELEQSLKSLSTTGLPTPSIAPRLPSKSKGAPPPLPQNTDPGRPAVVLSNDSEDATFAHKALDDLDNDLADLPELSDELVEIGQSQIMLLEHSRPDHVAIVRDELGPTRVEGHGGPTAPGMPPVAAPSAPLPAAPRDLIEKLYSDDAGDLFPPPLPEGPALEGEDRDDHDDDTRVPLPGDDGEEPTLDIRASGAPPMGLVSREGTTMEPLPLPEDGVSFEREIHDDLTALPPPNLTLPELTGPAVAPNAAITKVEGPGHTSDEMPTVQLHKAKPQLPSAPPVQPPLQSPRTTSLGGVDDDDLEPVAPTPSRAVALPTTQNVTTPVARPIAPPRSRKNDRSQTPLLFAAAAVAVAVVGAWFYLSSQPAEKELVEEKPPVADATPPSFDDGAVPVPVEVDPKAKSAKAPKGKDAAAKPDAKQPDAKAEPTTTPAAGNATPGADKPADDKAGAIAKVEPTVVPPTPEAPKPEGEKPAADKPVVDKPVVDKPAEGDAAKAVAVAAGAGTTCPRGMVLIEAGSFQAGSKASDPLRNFGERAAELVETTAYCIDYYEQPNDKSSLPTVGVSWNVAKDTCERKGKRLCSEVEWERACKGPEGLRFPYGNAYNAASCNTEDESGNPREIAPATSFKDCKSGFRVYALAGNVEEWTADAYPEGSGKTVKGGASNRPDFASRCAARRGVPAKTADPFLGFRCCSDLQ